MPTRPARNPLALFVALTFGFALLIGGLASHAADEVAKDGKPLFNGKDLSGWKFKQEAGGKAWSVVGDVKLDPETAADVPDYVACFRREARALQSAAPGLKVEWTVVENEPSRRVVWEGKGPVASRAISRRALVVEAAAGGRRAPERAPRRRRRRA